MRLGITTSAGSGGRGGGPKGPVDRHMESSAGTDRKEHPRTQRRERGTLSAGGTRRPFLPAKRVAKGSHKTAGGRCARLGEQHRHLWKKTTTVWVGWGGEGVPRESHPGDEGHTIVITRAKKPGDADSSGKKAAKRGWAHPQTPMLCALKQACQQGITSSGERKSRRGRKGETRN